MDKGSPSDPTKSQNSAPQPTEQTSAGLMLSKRLLLPFIVFVGLIGAGLYVKNKMISPESTSDVNPESFQGPAEVSGVVQLECTQTAAKILKNVDCVEAEAEFFAALEVCKNVGFSESNEGIFPDLVFKIAKCYFEIKKDGASAANALNKAQSEIGEWEVFEGPISCPSKNVIAARAEAYAEPRELNCSSNSLNDLTEKLKQKDFGALKSFLAPGGTIEQGFIDSDANCPDAFSAVLKNMEKLTSGAAFEVKEAIDISAANNPEVAVLDRYIEFTKSDKKIMMLHFRKGEKDCFEFAALLVESSETQPTD